MPMRHMGLPPNTIHLRRVGWITKLIVRLAVQASPTRTAEFVMAWLMMGWGAGVLLLGVVMVGPQYAYLLAIMPEDAWGWLAVIVGQLRAITLGINGAWRRTPLFRVAFAFAGFALWTTLGALYTASFLDGSARPFPMVGFIPVLMAVEVFAAFRCGQDGARYRSW